MIDSFGQREAVAHLLYAEVEALAQLAAQETSAATLSTKDQQQLETHLRGHLTSLADAVVMDSVSLLQAHLDHARYTAPGPSEAHDQALHAQLLALNQVLTRRLPVADKQLVTEYLAPMQHQLQLPLVKLRLPRPPELTPLARHYLDLLLEGQRTEALTLLRNEVKQGRDVRELYQEVFQPVQQQVGLLWHQNRISVAQEHFCTGATELAMALLHPYLHRAPRNGRRLVATTLSGDLHSMPVRIVCDFLEGEGWEPIWLGGNTPTATVWPTVEAYQADLLLVGASMNHHVAAVRRLLAERAAYPAAKRVRTLVGGAPFNADPQLWQAVGADAWAPDAPGAVEAVRKLL